MKNNRKVLFFYTLEFGAIVAALLYSLWGFSFVKGDDGMDQFYPIFVYCGKYIREVLKGIFHGQFHFPQFDFCIGMGEGIIPILNYYGFGDPFMLFSALTPVEHATFAYMATIFLKMYISGLCFLYYCRKRDLPDSTILAGLPFYLANNFLFYFCFQYPPYQSVMISLPLVCAGLDEVIKDKGNKKKASVVLILAVAFQALYGFYLLYMELIFAAVYALVRLLCFMESFRKLTGKIGILFLHVLAGLMTGGILFLPAVFGYVNSSRGGDFVGISWKVLLRLDADEYWKAVSSLVTPIGYSEVSLLVPAVACLAVILAAKKQGHKDLKIMMSILLLAYIEMRLTSYVACGFTVDVYYNRWIFCMVFVTAVLVCIGAQALDKVPVWGWGAYVAINVLYYVVLMLTEQKWFVEGTQIRRRVYFVYMLAAVIVSLLFIVAKKKNCMWVKVLAPACILATVLLNIIMLFAVTGEFGYGEKWYFKMYAAVRNEFQASNAQLYGIGEEGFFRKDIAGNAENEAAYIGHNGVREYFSMVNGNIYDFYYNFTITTGLNGSKYHLTGLDSRSGIEDLLAVRYYDDVKKDVVVENGNYLPIGFTFDKYYLEEEAERLSAIEKNANVLKTVILDQPVENVEKANLSEAKIGSWTEEGCTVEYVNVGFDSSMAEVNTDSKILVTIDSEEGGECYFYTDEFRLRRYTSVGKVYFGEAECEFRNNTAQNLLPEHPAMVCLGNVGKGETTFEISFGEKAGYTIGDIHIYTVDTNAIENWNRERQAETLEDICVEGGHVTGNIELTESKILFLSIPYGAGWTASVDGEETEILKADYGFMAIPLGEGYHEVELEYSTPGLLAGMLCTALGLVLVAFLLWQNRKGSSLPKER